MRSPSFTTPRSIALFTSLLCAWLLAGQAWAVPMQNDPNGFDGVLWGADLAESPRFVRVEDAGRVQTYERKDQPPTWADGPVDLLRFTCVEGKFARVMIRYSGKDTHERLFAYLQQQFGPVDRAPGHITGGAVKFFDWQGADSDLTLRYDARSSQGVIFFESQVFRSKFSDTHSPSAF